MTTDAPDQEQRDLALLARDRTVLIDAGAGAGKTTLLVERILTLIAPADDSARALPLGRIAAVTFTRRAAGELRLRVRQRILSLLARADTSEPRKKLLLDALGTLDASFIGTIHSFADRLLRLQPMKARLSPAYQIAEDIDGLVDETFGLLLQAVQSGTLVAELPGEDPSYVAEVERTLQEALRAGLVVRSREQPPKRPVVGLDLLVRGFVIHRDQDVSDTLGAIFDRASFDQRACEFVAAIKGISDDTHGTRWLEALARRLTELLDEPDDIALYELVRRIEGGRASIKKTKDFVKKSPALAVWNAFVAENGFADKLVNPLVAAMARKLARTRHAVCRLYGKVKARREVVDSIDLLLVLRDLVRDDRDARAFYQGMFDHILVDELQDTDPLQAEIVLFLSEDAPNAARWQDVIVGCGRLTLVGDPKQSIYRFRRADVGMYDRMREQVKASDHVDVTLTANFRSVPRLIEWANQRFSAVLGVSPDSRQFDPESGQVYHRSQVAARASGGGRPVHHLSYAFADGDEHPAGEARALEAAALAAYLRHLNAHARIKWSDVAVLALVTTNVHYLSRALDDHHVPHSMAGGTLFTTDPLHRQFVLGLRAIADRNDGVAEAALFRPPFFAIDLLDLVRDKMNTGEVAAQRGAAARAWLRETRRRRFARTPGQTARSLLEETGIGRIAALGPNGEQRLRHLRELCLTLEVDAATLGLDFDGVTARMRTWIDHPIQLDPPRPVGSDALQILTVHQAKGLEFPVVVLWDGMGLWPSQDSTRPWQADRDGNGWSLKTNDLAWEEPADAGRLARERRYGDAERKRLVYVAATRARDLLIIPKPAWPQAPEKYIHAHLLADSDPSLVQDVETFIDSNGATWSPSPVALATPTSALDVKHLGQWSALADEARRPRHTPRSVTGIAKVPVAALRVDDVDLPVSPRPARTSRFGPVFGEVVHQAIGLVLQRGAAVEGAVASAVHAHGLTEHLDDAIADVERAIAALRGAEIAGDAVTLRVEYPIAFARDGGLVSGYIDLLAATTSGLVVVDFKTDAPPASGTAIEKTFPSYVTQVRTYAEIAGAKRAALLFTATGQLAWIN